MNMLKRFKRTTIGTHHSIKRILTSKTHGNFHSFLYSTHLLTTLITGHYLWMLPTMLLIKHNTMSTIFTDTWCQTEHTTTWHQTHQWRIIDLSFWQEAALLQLEDMHLIGLEITLELGNTLSIQLQESWTWTCSVSHKLELMFAVSSEQQEMMKCAQGGFRLLNSTHLPDSTTSMTVIQMNHTLWMPPTNHLLKKLCSKDINS